VSNHIDVDAARPVLEGVFAEYVAIKRLPSIAWGLVDHGELVLAHNEHAVYRIASMTKSFTCAAILLLRDDGVLALDDRIAQHAPEFAHIRGAASDSPPITIRHLMTMGSGLATDDAWADRHLDVSDDQLDAWLERGGLFAAAPDTMFEYSNLGFGLLGRVVLRASGCRLQDVVTDRLLLPLGMTATTWTPTAAAEAGWRADDDTIEEVALGDGAIAPMGGIFTTVVDLARWVGFLADAFPPRDDIDDGPLCRASRREMQQIHRGFPPRVVTTRDGRKRTLTGGYGFGVNVMYHEDVGWVVTHSGGLPGFGSNMRWIPSVGVGLIAFANQTYAPMAEATAAALDALVANGVLHRAAPPVSHSVVDAGERLVQLHNHWDDATAAALFADNVDLDLARTERAHAAASLFDTHGPFSFARIEPESDSSGVAIAHGPRVELRIDYQLSPLLPARVQWYEAEVVE
jgi:CubicO group peptidase (beta-lactamase class C family)